MVDATMASRNDGSLLRGEEIAGGMNQYSCPDSTSHRELDNHDPQISSPSPHRLREEALATDTSVLREVILAAAKKFSIDIPREALPVIALDTLRPKVEGYDETATVGYQINQLPKYDIFYSYPQESSTPGEFEPMMTRLPFHPPSRGLTEICVWKFRDVDRGHWLNLQELSYDSMGYVCPLESNLERMNQVPPIIKERVVGAHFSLPIRLLD